MASKTPDQDDTFIAAQRGILESIAFGRPLYQVLKAIVELIEARSNDMLCSILLLDGDRIRHVAAPKLPPEYIAAIEGARIGPNAGSCGTAAYTGQVVIVKDIATHPTWRDYRHLALPHGLRACWSAPIFTPERQVLGTFAMYYRECREPTAQEKEWVEVATYVAYVAIISARFRLNEIERLRMEAQVRHGEHLRSVILDNIDDAIFYVQVEAEGQYRVLSVNKAYARMFATAGNIVGRLVHEYLPPDVREEILARYAQAMRTGERQRWEATRRAGPKHIEVTIIPICDPQGRCTNFVGTVHDVTSRIDAENERSQLQEKLHQAQRMQALGTLAGGIAHDFNNILAAIGGNAELLLSELAEQSSCRTYASQILRASGRAAELVRQILSFSRSSQPSYAALDPIPVTMEALNLLRLTLPRSIKIETHFARDTPGIRADASQFHQILINLITNAAHAYAGEGVVDVSIYPATTSDIAQAEGVRLGPGNYVCVRVADSGIGMDAATLQRAFDPFFTTRPPGEGTGLGLSVVHSIVENHHGSIGIQSAPGKGTTVAVCLPAAEIESGIAAAQATSHRGNGERILYVDDEDALVALMETSLIKLGYRVRGYVDPAIALQEFARTPYDFDIVITDLAMPGMNGRQFAAGIREIRQDVPIIMTSGYIRNEDREAARELQITQIVYKSNTVQQLTEALASEIAAFAARGEQR
jgi:PAS domain S-box-containing protein